MALNKKILVTFCSSWGTRHGGINSFNFDLLRAVQALAFSALKTVCIVLRATPEEIAQAERECGVLLLSLDAADPKYFNPELEPLAWNKLQALLNNKGLDWQPEHGIWLGHDRITGAIALAARTAHGGRCALIHHMSFAHYEMYAENSALADQKSREQKQLFKRADRVFGVGPLLTNALCELWHLPEAQMLVPGLADDLIGRPCHPAAKNFFHGFMSGRLTEDAKKIKQAQLGIAGFGMAIAKASADDALPAVLRGGKAKLLLRGVSFEQVQEGGEPREPTEQALQAFAKTYAGRIYPLQALPFTTNREDLFDDLSGASVALMPSWHEGFGLTGWEAIAAGVPLIVSNGSGLYQLLEQYREGLFASAVQMIDVHGDDKEPFFDEEQDLPAVAQAIIRVAADPQKFKTKAIQLRTELLQLYTWKACAATLLHGLGWGDAVPADTALPGSAASADTPGHTSAPGPTHAGAATHTGIPVQPPARQGTGATPAARQVSLLEIPGKVWQPGSDIASHLLRAEEEAVPFDPEREPFLQNQLDWAQNDGNPLALRLLIGPGGAGKTRLALKICQRLHAQGWEAGFLRGSGLPKELKQLASQINQAARPCCIVLDYAETRQEMLLELIKSLQLARLKNPLRILLLARDGSDWWRILPTKDKICTALLEGPATSGPYALPPLHDTPEKRQQAYQLAMAALAEPLQRPIPEHHPTLDAEHFAHPLYIQIAALMALFGEHLNTAAALPTALVNHERRYWRKALQGVAADTDLLQNQAEWLMTLATLANGFAKVDKVEKLWQKIGGEKSWLATLFHRMAALYPGSTGLDGLRPDLLGEALVAQMLTSNIAPAMLDALLKDGKAEIRQNCLAVLARLAAKRQDVAEVVNHAIERNFAHIVLDVIAVAIATPGSLADQAGANFGKLPRAKQAELADGLHELLEAKVENLAELNIAIAQLVADKLKPAPGSRDLKAKGRYGLAMVQLAGALEANQRTADALRAANVAVTMFGTASSTMVQYEQYLAGALDLQAVLLAETGKVDEALATSAQALAIWTRLAQANPVQFEKDWAQSLNSHAIRLAECGQPAEALTTSAQALAIRERLAQANPAQFEKAWADSLHNHANLLEECGQPAEAFATSAQALAILARLAQANPAQFEKAWAQSLRSHAHMLAEQGDFLTASQYSSQALQRHRTRTANDPAQRAYDVALAQFDYQLWQWLADPQLGLAVPELDWSAINPLQQRIVLQFYHHWLTVLVTPTASTLNAAWQAWQAMNPAQQQSFEAAGLLLSALLAHHLGPAAAPENWQAHYARFSQTRQGHLPAWMLATAQRMGLRLPQP